MIDHDTDSYQKIARAFVDGKPSGNLTRDHIVDNITLYWLTRTGASAARSYWEESQETRPCSRPCSPAGSDPVGFTTFPGEIWPTPRSWVEKAYPNVNYFNEVDKGGHFAAWEEPQLFSEELRAAFKPDEATPGESAHADTPSPGNSMQICRAARRCCLVVADAVVGLGRAAAMREPRKHARPREHAATRLVELEAAMNAEPLLDPDGEDRLFDLAMAAALLYVRRIG
jgi:hypothetical protein